MTHPHKVILKSVFVPHIFAWSKVGPDDKYSWVAFHASDEGSPWTYGWGRSRAEAKANLARLDRERAK